jgi:hypothetical protein
MESSDEIDAVSVSIPSKRLGRPSICRIHDTTTYSSSVETARCARASRFELSAEASHSPRIPGPVAVLGKYAMNIGCCQW